MTKTYLETEIDQDSISEDLTSDFDEPTVECSSEEESEEGAPEESGESESSELAPPKEFDWSSVEYKLLTKSLWGRSFQNKEFKAASLAEVAALVSDNVNKTVSGMLLVDSESMSKMQIQIYSTSNPAVYRIRTNLKELNDVDCDSIEEYLRQNILDNWSPPPTVVVLTKEQAQEWKDFFDKNSGLSEDEMVAAFEKFKGELVEKSKNC